MPERGATFSTASRKTTAREKASSPVEQPAPQPRRTLPGEQLVTSVLGQHVILAATPGDESATVASAVDVVAGEARADRGATEIPLPDEIAAALAEAVGDERREVLIDLVRRNVVSNNEARVRAANKDAFPA